MEHDRQGIWRLGSLGKLGEAEASAVRRKERSAEKKLYVLGCEFKISSPCGAFEYGLEASALNNENRLLLTRNETSPILCDAGACTGCACTDS